MGVAEVQMVQMEQLAMAACVRLQPQNTKDESRGMTQICTTKSYELLYTEI